MLSDKDCGIDIQKIDPKIDKIARKFISDKEWEYLDEEFRTEQMHVFWCAKEAMYKLYGKRKLDFRQHLYLYPFQWREKGIVKGAIEKEKYHKELNVHYQKIENYILAWVVA